MEFWEDAEFKKLDKEGQYKFVKEYFSQKEPSFSTLKPDEQTGFVSDFLSSKYPEDKSVWGKLKGHWDLGEYTIKLGEAQAQRVYGKDTPELQNRVKRLKETAPAVAKGRNVLEKAVFSAAEFLPLMTRSTGEYFKHGIGGAIAGAGAAAVGGQLGPQVATPEELVTVPVAAGIGMQIGGTYGSVKYIMDIEAGLAYDSMSDMGVEDQYSKPIAMAVGAINAALEVVQIKRIPGLNKLFRGGTNQALTKATKPLLRGAAKYGKFVAQETREEVMQEAVSILGEEIGKNIGCKANCNGT